MKIEGVVLAIDRAAFNQGENAKYDFQISGGGTAQTIVARGPGAVCYRLQSEVSVQQTTSFHSNSKLNKRSM